MTLLESENIPMGTTAPDFENLPATDGKSYGLESFKEKKILIIVFMCNHCPYVQAVINRLIAIQKDYEEKDIQIVGINPNNVDEYPEDNFENMKKLAKEKGINFIYLRDDSQKISKAYKAQCTPDIFVYGKEQKLIYHGRIDDNWQNPEQVTTQDLREALDKYLKNQEIVETQFPSMGCSIKWN